MLPELLTEIPGPRSRELALELRRYESRNVTYLSSGFPVFWARAHETNIWDVDGNRFLDLTSAFSVASLGYTPTAVVQAVQDQAGQLYHAMGDVHPTAEKVKLCRRLSQLTFEAWGEGSAKTLLTNSGSEAVEAALKTAFLHTGKTGVLAFTNSYHGLGFGSLAVTGREDFQRRFRPQLADFVRFLPFPSAGESIAPGDYEKQLRTALSSGDCGAILVEPLQGRGGDIVPPDWFLPLLRRVADERRSLLIADEIYTGWYRTGRRFACDHWNVVPDIICLGKALTSGFPLSACVARAAIMEAWPESDGEALYTSTFLGNPLGCRMALASLGELEKPGLAEMVCQKGEYLQKKLRDLPSMERPHGRGLMIGLKVPAPQAGPIIEGMLKRGLIILSGGPDRNILSLTPPFLISKEEIDFAVEALRQELSQR
jgi:4-aminobutyrate aminotransferase/(S)-3-amino-2-methylpropionate transaminase